MLNHHNSRIRTIFFVFVTALFSTLSCKQTNNNQANYEKLVKTFEVKSVSEDNEKYFSGVMEEAEAVNLAFRVAGPIKKVYVKEGDYVKKGTLLAKMDNRDYELQKNAIEAKVKQLRKEYKRIAELNKRKSVADNDFEKMKAGKEMAEAKLKNALDQLEDTKLYAPFSGYISEVFFESGELVNLGMPVAKIIDIEQLKVEINVPVSLFIKQDEIIEISCTQEAIPDKVFPLRLYANNIKANSNGLYSFYLHYEPEKNSKLSPGMNVLVSIKFKKHTSQFFKIPMSAIFEKNDSSFVWIIENETVKARNIATNHSPNNGYVGVTKGLKIGEKIVISGIHLLKEDDKVKCLAPKSKTNIGNIL